MQKPHLVVVREISIGGLVEAVNIAGDRWLAWERPVSSMRTPTYVCVNRSLMMEQAELPEIVAELFSNKTAIDIARRFNIEVVEKRYVA